MDAPRAIVFVKLSAIGDVLHGVPAAVAAKRRFPRTRIGWVVEGRAADVLSGHPCIDHLFRLPRGWLKSPAAVWSLRRQLRGFDADVAVDMQGLLKSGVATWLTGARLRIGHAAPESREYSSLSLTRTVPAGGGHEVDRNLGLLAPLVGVEVFQRCHAQVLHDANVLPSATIGRCFNPSNVLRPMAESCRQTASTTCSMLANTSGC